MVHFVPVFDVVGKGVDRGYLEKQVADASMNGPNI